MSVEDLNVERVARAIQERMLEPGWDDPRELARAAIAAMLTPAEALLARAGYPVTDKP